MNEPNPVNCTDEDFSKLKSIKDDSFAEKIQRMNKEMEKVRRDYIRKSVASEISASKVILNS